MVDPRVIGATLLIIGVIGLIFSEKMNEPKPTKTKRVKKSRKNKNLRKD